MKADNKTVYGLTIDRNNKKIRVTKDKKWQTEELKRILDLSKTFIVSIDANTYISYSKDELDKVSAIIKNSKNY